MIKRLQKIMMKKFNNGLVHPHNLNVYMKAMKTIGNQISKFDRFVSVKANF